MSEKLPLSASDSDPAGEETENSAERAQSGAGSRSRAGGPRPLPRYLPVAPEQIDAAGQGARSRALGHLLPQASRHADAVALEENTPLRQVLSEYLRVLFKYRYLLLGCIVLGVIASLLYAFTVTPIYTAATRMRIGTYEPMLTATRVEDVLQERSKESTYLETQLEEMRSYTLADRVLGKPSVLEALKAKPATGFFANLFRSEKPDSLITAAVDKNYKHSLKEITRYLSRINITPIRRTQLVVVEAVSESPEVAAMLANEHSDEYIRWMRESRVQQQSRGLQFLSQQAEELREKVADLEREIADYAEANSIVALNKDENIVVQKMSQVNELLTASMARRIEAENLHLEAESALESPSAGFDDQSTQLMRSELAKLEGEYQELSAKFMPGYPKMRQLKAQIDGIKSSIVDQRRQIVLGLKAKAQAAAEEEKRMREELEQQKSQAFELSKRQVQYNILNRELSTSRELLESVLRQMKETSLAVESNSTNVAIVDSAVVPTSPSFPRKRLILLLGIIAGTGLGLALVLLLSQLDNTIRTPEDMKQFLGVASLGVVPSFGLTASPGDELSEEEKASGAAGGSLLVVRDASVPPVLFVDQPRGLAAEAYRTIRTAILLSQAGEPPRTILVSSAQSSEGKTTSSVNLAAALASSGGRVVILDADLRRPSLHTHFGVEYGGIGLVDVLTGQRTLDEVIRADLIMRVSMIPSGRTPPNPAELLGSLEMASLLDELASRFDYVLIDSPPILPVTDSVVLARYVDGVVLVVRSSSTPRKVVKDAVHRLQVVGARVLGTILNDVNIKSGDYYYYNRYYHSYYMSSDAASKGASSRKGADARRDSGGASQQRTSASGNSTQRVAGDD